MFTCQHCGKENPDDANYCLSCGQKIEIVNSISCPNCGKQNPVDAKYCFSCGKQITNELLITPSNDMDLSSDNSNRRKRVLLIIGKILIAILVLINGYVLFISSSMSLFMLTTIADTKAAIDVIENQGPSFTIVDKKYTYYDDINQYCNDRYDYDKQCFDGDKLISKIRANMIFLTFPIASILIYIWCWYLYFRKKLLTTIVLTILGFIMEIISIVLSIFLIMAQA